jgi:hypothetical protein
MYWNFVAIDGVIKNQINTQLYATLKGKESVDLKIGDYEMGFRLIMSTYMIWQIYEKCHKHNIEEHNFFRDFKQAFNSVNRALIPNCLKLFNVPSKLIKLINSTLQHNKVKVKINGTLTEQFEVSTGVK